jgi:hypothetical protein
MNKNLNINVILLFCSAANIASSCDSVMVKFVTHPLMGGPLSIEWDVESECTEMYVDEGDHVFDLQDTVLTLTFCLDSGEYRARAKCDFDFEPGMFDIYVIMNNDSLSMNQPFEFNDDDLRFYFNVHVACEDEVQPTALVPIEMNQFAIYPNPLRTGEICFISTDYPEPFKYWLVDQLGRKIEVCNGSITQSRYDLCTEAISRLNPGTYILMIQSSKNSGAIRIVVI